MIRTIGMFATMLRMESEQKALMVRFGEEYRVERITQDMGSVIGVWYTIKPVDNSRLVYMQVSQEMVRGVFDLDLLCQMIRERLDELEA